MQDVYIIDALRTSVGKYGGSLSTVRADDMAAHVIRKILERNSLINKEDIDDVILGCANQAGEDNRNIARMALLLAGLPMSVPGETVNRLCSSGMAAVINASRTIKTGDAELIIAGGVENMTRSPYVIPKSPAPFSRTVEIYDTTLSWRFVNPKMKEMYGIDSMGETAENLAEKYNITRREQDRFAYMSQTRAAAARESGRFEKEIVPIEVHQDKISFIFKNDEFIRKDTTVETLEKLKPAFREDGTVTAGNSSGLNDGASALILASDNALKKYSLKPRARIVSSAVVGVEPRIMGIGPVEASKKALAKAGLIMKDMDIIEINEAFAAQVLSCLKEWGLDTLDERLNPNGGAIALGHPLGMSGARLITTALYELEEKKKRYALCTLCVGVGQGYATIIEKLG